MSDQTTMMSVASVSETKIVRVPETRDGNWSCMPEHYEARLPDGRIVWAPTRELCIAKLKELADAD